MTAVRVSPTDASQRYAVYLPTRYDTGHRLPLLIVMDPRGRAMLAMRKFQNPAEQFGYVVLSSYNTASDGPMEPNIRAVNAMLADAQRSLAIDTGRIYLAGFSGTARAAWLFADQLPTYIAGVFGAGAGLPWSGIEGAVKLRGPARYGFFGTSGTSDFNYEEVRALEHQLASSPIAHRFEYFDGPHGWPPDSLCAEGVAWFEVQAMKAGLTSKRDSLIDSWYTSRLAVAQADEARGAAYDASRGYQALVTDLKPLHDVALPRARAAALASSRALREQTEHREQLAVRYQGSVAALRDFQDRVRQDKRAPSLQSALKDLKVADLQRMAADSTDRASAATARQALALYYVHTAYYGPEQYLTAHDPARALGLLVVANAIRANDVEVCFNMARAYALSDRPSDAIASLRCAATSGHLTVADVRDEHAFDRIRSDTAFVAIAAHLPSVEAAN